MIQFTLHGTLADAIDDLVEERRAQDDKWGQQNHPDGTSTHLSPLAAAAKRMADEAARQGRISWSDILTEEFVEALAESDPKRLREELVQVAAVAVAWVEAIDRRLAALCGMCGGTSYELCDGHQAAEDATW